MAERKPMSKRRRRSILEQIGSPDGRVRGWHRACPATKAPALGSSYDALFLNEYGEVCCKECGSVDLGVDRSRRWLRQTREAG